jgi:hypothetical protein
MYSTQGVFGTWRGDSKTKYNITSIVGNSPIQRLFNRPSVAAAAAVITAGTDFLKSHAGQSVIVPEFHGHPPQLRFFFLETVSYNRRNCAIKKCVCGGGEAQPCL